MQTPPINLADLAPRLFAHCRRAGADGGLSLGRQKGRTRGLGRGHARGLVFFGAGPDVLVYSQLRGLLLTLYVLYIIWMALVLYRVVDEAGAITVIGQGIARLTGRADHAAPAAGLGL